MKNIRLLGLVTVVLLFASTAFAVDSITLAGNLNEVQYGGNYLKYDGEWVGPYLATITYGSSQPYTGYLACLDFTKSTYIGQLYTGVWSTNYTDTNLKEASWLTDHLYGLTPSTPNAVATSGPISFAIWTVMGYGTSLPNLDAAGLSAMQTWIQEATTAVQGGYIPDSPLFTPNDITSQRFMTPVPIPGALWLLGSGLLGLVGIRRRVKK